MHSFRYPFKVHIKSCAHKIVESRSAICEAKLFCPFMLAHGCVFQELMDIVFDQKFAVVGEQLPVSLGFQNVIFVMEDVDAASPIVHSRDRSKRKRGSKTTVEVCVSIVRSAFSSTAVLIRLLLWKPQL